MATSAPAGNGWAKASRAPVLSAERSGTPSSTTTPSGDALPDNSAEPAATAHTAIGTADRRRNSRVRRIGHGVSSSTASANADPAIQ